MTKNAKKSKKIPINLHLEIPIAAQECRYMHCCHFRTKRKTNCYHLGHQCSHQIWLEAAGYHLDSNLDYEFGWHYHCSQLKFSLRKMQSHFYVHWGLFYHFLSRNCSRSRDFAPIFDLCGQLPLIGFWFCALAKTLKLLKYQEY